jgi:hypothetical protein
MAPFVNIHVPGLHSLFQYGAHGTNNPGLPFLSRTFAYKQKWTAFGGRECAVIYPGVPHDLNGINVDSRISDTHVCVEYKFASIDSPLHEGVLLIPVADLECR